MIQQQPHDDAQVVENFLANLDRIDPAEDLPGEWAAAELFCTRYGSVRGLQLWVDLRRRVDRLERRRAAPWAWIPTTGARPYPRYVQQFLCGAARDAEQFRALLEEVLGCGCEPVGDSIEVDGVHLTLGYESGGGRSLRAEEPCPTCGDPVRSVPIESRSDLTVFSCGGHRAPHVHGWLSGDA